MVLERIKQNAQLILESLYRYETLDFKKKQENDKKKLREIEDEIQNLKNFIISFSSEIKSLINEEKLNLYKNERRP